MEEQLPAVNALQKVVEDNISDLHRAGYGWILNAVKDEKSGVLNIAVDPVLPPVDDFEAPTAWRNHTFLDHTSLMAYAERWGDPEDSAIFYDDNGIALVIDEVKNVGKREVLRMPFKFSDAWNAWKGLIGRPIQYIALRDVLPLLRHTMANPGLLLALRSIKYTEQVKVDSEIREEVGDAHYGIAFTVSGVGDSIKNIPRKFTISVPVLDIDTIASHKWVSIEVGVEVVMPKEQGGPLCICLVAPQFDQQKKIRLAELMEEVRGGLGQDWMVCNGTFGETSREIGHKGRLVRRGDDE